MANILRLTTKTKDGIRSVAFDRDNVEMNCCAKRTTTGTAYIHIAVKNLESDKNLFFKDIYDKARVTSIDNNVDDLNIAEYLDEVTNEELFNMLLMAKHVVFTLEEDSQLIEIFQ